MKDNKDYLVQTRANSHAGAVAENDRTREQQQLSSPQTQPSTPANHYEDHKLTRRYSFDDNGGSYYGL